MLSEVISRFRARSEVPPKAKKKVVRKSGKINKKKVKAIQEKSLKPARDRLKKIKEVIKKWEKSTL